MPCSMGTRGRGNADGTGQHDLHRVREVPGEKWKSLRDRDGFPIRASWIDQCGVGETKDWPKLWETCIYEASQATVLIVYREEGEILKGAWVELGAALASETPVYLVGCSEFSVRHHRLITLCASMDEALLLAMDEVNSD